MFLEKSIEVCTFSYSGATVRTLWERIDLLPLKKLDFVVVYIGGNDLQNGGRGSAVEYPFSKRLNNLPSGNP